MVDLDQREVTPDAVAFRVRLVLARPDPSYRFNATTRHRLPVVVVAGLAAAPEDFDAHVAEYDALLQRLTWGSPRTDEPARPRPPQAR